MEPSLRTLRFRLQAAGVLPRTRLARAACYLLGLDLLLFALQKLLGLFKVSFGLALSVWIGILSFLAYGTFHSDVVPIRSRSNRYRYRVARAAGSTASTSRTSTRPLPKLSSKFCLVE